MAELSISVMKVEDLKFKALTQEEIDEIKIEAYNYEY